MSELDQLAELSRRPDRLPRKISDVCEFVRDGDWIETKDQGGDAYRLLQVSNIGVGHFIETGKYRYINKETFERLNCTEIQNNDVLVARMPEPTGRAWWAHTLSGKAITAVDVAILRPDPSAVLGQYLAYVLNSPACLSLVNSMTTGTTRLRIRRHDIAQIKISLPSLIEQREIASILGALDDKIELNRRMNATLKAMARAFFQSWFVDFDPVRAKAEGRQPVGMDPDTAALFPDSFEDSELGPIPKGWEIRPLDEIAHFLNGLALQKFPVSGSTSLPVVKIAQLNNGHDTTRADRCSDNIPQDYVVRDGDVLFSWSGSLEVEVWTGGDGALNQHLFKVSSQTYPKWFYYLWTLSHLENFRSIAAGKATTMGHIQRKHLSDAKVLIPSSTLLLKLGEIFAPLVASSTARMLHAKDLEKLRDTLLPKLLDGELRVGDFAA